MKTTILKSAALLLFAAFAFSCDSESSSNDENFFNLNVGNEWVYKKYENSQANPTVLTFSGITDSVKVQEIVQLNGISFSKMQHRYFNNGLLAETEYQYVRVNNNGHLVGLAPDNDGIIENPGDITEENSGSVMHPGLDTDFTYMRDEPGGGQTFHHVIPDMDMAVEGNVYSISPYVGDYTPSGQTAYTKRVEYNYEAQTGLVKRVCHMIGGTYMWEDRLVSATIVD